MLPPPVPGAVAVAFDEGVAQQLVAALERLARALGRLAQASTDGAATARVDWHGFTRTWFDTGHEALAADLHHAARDARRTAALVQEATAGATLLQEQRNHEATAGREAGPGRAGSPSEAPGPTP